MKNMRLKKGIFSSLLRFSSSMSTNTIGSAMKVDVPSISASVHFCKMFSDNYGYCIVDGASGKAAVVDPGEPEHVYNMCQALGITPSMVLCTHHHNDHSGGNAFFKEMMPAIEVVGTKYETIPSVTQPVGSGDRVLLGELVIDTLYTPCHTKGHVVFHVTSAADASAPGVLFSGDTLFVGGCGKFFEGTPAEMLANMRLLRQLPAETAVFCAHEYTVSNLKFLASVDDTVTPRLKEAMATRERKKPTVPTTIGDEASYNLFMRCDDENVQEMMRAPGDPETTMQRLREMKNSFR